MSLGFRPPSTLNHVLVVAGPLVGVGSLLFGFSISCGPGGYPPGETPRGFHRVVFDWYRVGIAYGNGCEFTYHPLVLLAGIALVGAGVASFAAVWRYLERIDSA